MLSTKCDLQGIFVHFHFILFSLRFVSENRTPLGAIVLVRQFLSSLSLVKAGMHFFKYPKGFTRVVIFN